MDITPGWARMMEEARVAPAEPLPGHDDPQGPALPYQVRVECVWIGMVVGISSV